MRAPIVWRLSHARTVQIAVRNPLVMAILNCTPDSFSDGGAHNDPEGACTYAESALASGADIIDIGGESTRPGSTSVPCDEQIARTRPVTERLARAHATAILSIDTTRAEVARAALDAGATIVNDVSAGADDAALWPLIAARGCGYVLMHRLCAPSEDSYSDQYRQPPRYESSGGDVVAHVCAWLSARAELAQSAGIARESIAIDPGLGFGKSVAQNVALVERMSEVVALGYPVVVSASRKSFLGALTGESDPRGRDAASVTVALAMSRSGVAVVRAHDAARHREALRSQGDSA